MYRLFQGTLSDHGLNPVDVSVEAEPEYKPGDITVRYYRVRCGDIPGQQLSPGDERQLALPIGVYRAVVVKCVPGLTTFEAYPS